MKDNECAKLMKKLVKIKVILDRDTNTHTWGKLQDYKSIEIPTHRQNKIRILKYNSHYSRSLIIKIS